MLILLHVEHYEILDIFYVGNVTENGEEADFYIDGADENNSNWLRYINSARCKTGYRNIYQYYIAYSRQRYHIRRCILYTIVYLSVCFRFLVEEEQNLYPLEFNSSIFYIVYKNVEAGSELLGIF